MTTEDERKDDATANATTTATGSTGSSTESKEIDELLRRSAQYKDLPVSVRLPESINITMIDLGNCGLSSLPTQMPLMLPNVKILFLSNNQFLEMPPIISQFAHLDMIAFKGNQMTHIHPNCFVPETTLRWIILTNNRIAALPDSIGNCTKLQKFMLSGNCLSTIPTTIANCTELELIRLSCNQLLEPPLHLLHLPKLKWVAFGRNTFLDSVLPVVPGLTATTNANTHANRNANRNIVLDQDETTGTVLGHGASGVTRAVTVPASLIFDAPNSDDSVVTVAVKTYHDDMITSDGTPELERHIALLVSRIQQQHLKGDTGINNSSSPTTGSCDAVVSSAMAKTGFIHVYGQCDRTGSLVMEYLHMFQTIADPPSFDSCTRDVYTPIDKDNTWTSTDTIHFINVLLYSLQLLHTHGITHGDLYGHNILVSYGNQQLRTTRDTTFASINVRLSDFGASFMYDSNADYGKYIQLIEIRAFQVLLEEVLEHYYDGSADDENSSRTTNLLSNLIEQCNKVTTFEELYIFLQQQQLQDIANAFDTGIAIE